MQEGTRTCLPKEMFKHEGIKKKLKIESGLFLVIEKKFLVRRPYSAGDEGSTVTIEI